MAWRRFKRAKDSVILHPDLFVSRACSVTARDILSPYAPMPRLLKDFRGRWYVEYWHRGLLGCGGRERKTERNNAGKLEPGYSAQFDAAASNRHEQEKSIRPTRLLSKGLPPWERIGRIKEFGKKNRKKQSSRGGK